MTPIEQALAKVRELREAERKMTAAPVKVEPVIMAPHRDHFGGDRFPLQGNPDGTSRTYPLTEAYGNAEGFAVLRNAALAMLDLLEALLVQVTSHEYFPEGDLCSECDKTTAALAAFVEGSDGK